MATPGTIRNILKAHHWPQHRQQPKDKNWVYGHIVNLWRHGLSEKKNGLTDQEKQPKLFLPYIAG